MAQITSDWTAADLVERFGAIPLSRIRMDPPPGTATEEDVVHIHDHEDRLFELVDGILVEKTVGWYESLLAGELFRLLSSFVKKHDLGIVLPPDGMMRLWPGLIRLPDVAFVSWERLSDQADPREAVLPMGPDLAVEVISSSNTRKEMTRKVTEYFAAGAVAVWYFYPEPRNVRVYTSSRKHTVLGEGDTLDGGDLLPGFRLDLRKFFNPRLRRKK